MSLARTILRIAAVQAITGNTLAGDAVFDSDIDPIDQRVSSADEPRPLIVIYTDDDQSTPTGFADFLQGGQVELVIEVVYAGRTTVSLDPDGPDGPETAEIIEISGRDAANEILLDLIERQAIRALTMGADTWSQIWRLVASNCARRLSRRGASAEQGNRFAIRQVVLTLEPLVDPVPGQPLKEGSAWDRALSLMSESQFGRIADVLREDAEGDPITEWRRFAGQLGVNLETISGIGLGPVGADDPVPLEEAEFEDGNRDDP